MLFRTRNNTETRTAGSASGLEKRTRGNAGTAPPARPEWIRPFTGLTPAQFRRLVRVVAQRGGEEICDGRPGRQWALDLADRVLLVAAYWRTNVTMRRIGPLFGVSHSAAHRVIDTVGPLLALALARRRPVDQVSIVDGTLIPTGDHTLAASSKTYRYSTYLQVAIDANTRLVVALGDPPPGNRHDTVVYRSSGINAKLAGRAIMADGAYRGNPEVIIPYRKPEDGSALPQWQQDVNAVPRSVRARVEHTLARMKEWSRDHLHRRIIDDDRSNAGATRELRDVL